MSGGTDGASYVVASTFDTVPMANQSGRIAVTLTNSGTSTWSGYGLAALVFASGNTSGTGTPLTTGPAVGISGTVAPAGTAAVEGITPAENPGSYEICWDVVNAAGATFKSEGATQFCSPYTIQQYPAQVNEQEPLPGTDVNTQTPQLAASAVVPGGYPATPAFSFAFKLLSGPSLTSTVLQSSGWVASNGSSWSPKALNWGTTYYWTVTVTDAATLPSVSSTSLTWTTPISFVVGNAQPNVTYRFGSKYQTGDGNPVMTSDLGSANYDGSGKTVDPKTANVTQRVTDASVASTGPPLSIVRTYNSLDPRTSQALGSGWSSTLDMSLVPDSDGTGALILTLADGQQVRFAKNASGGYAPPQDMYAVVSALSGGGFAVTDQSGTTYGFGHASGSNWLISQVTDASGRSLAFSYSSGSLTAVTSTTSGRALHLTWSTPSGASVPHVATVSTDPVTAGQPGTALTWTYGYSGDLLSSVCPPGTTTACTSYSYVTNGSHAPESVLNAAPTAYYRLDDPAGATVAANQVPVDDLTTLDPPAAEFGTTPGVPGPISGVTATSFNGTSSYIVMDGEWCSTPGQVSSCQATGDTGRVLGGTNATMAVSVWFKTTAATGQILAVTPGLPGGLSSGSLMPVLWVSGGKLKGFGGCPLLQACTTMSSAGTVNDGAWHQAVLIAGSALYLDGAQVATATGGGPGSTGIPSGQVLLGAGAISTENDSAIAWQYYNGSLADLSFYQNQMPSPATVAAQYAAETHPAAELSSITSPGGRTELSATYDTVNDRVATLADAHGGTWAYTSPVSGSSSSAYGDALLGSSPEDFWPLSDTAGPLAHDMVGGAATAANPRPAATYANVTLGAAGPTGFPDGTAATFSGSGSQVSVPGGYFAGTSTESAELWFKTTSAGGTLLSSGTGTGGEPLSAWLANGCLTAAVGSTQLSGGIFGICTGTNTVDDGNWHQLILTVGPVQTSTGFIGSTQSQTATLYVDGASAATASLTLPGTTSPAGYTAYLGTGSHGSFTGSLADVSLYTRQLTSSEVKSHYDALVVTVTPPSSITFLGGSSTPITLPTLNAQTITVTNPAGQHATYVYAAGDLLRTVDVLGGVTSYGYDSASRATTITDPDGDTTYTTHDAHNNVTSTTTCAAVNNCQTAYTSYYENLATPLDPRNDKPTDSRDARSSSPSDPAYDTVTAYTATAMIASVTKPPTAACPAGCKTSYAYTAGTEAAVGGGTEPAGLVASITAPGGGVTSYKYNSGGDLMQTTSPLGLVNTYAYDNLGRQLSQAQVSDTYPNGLTTRYTYDGQDRVLTETDPLITDRVTGAPHTKVTTYTYDPDDEVLTTTVSDATGGDPSRTTTSTYDAHGNLASTKDALGNITSYTYDGLGDRVTETNPAGVTTAYGYDAAADLLTTTLDGYTGNPSNPVAPTNLIEESRAYDPGGRLASVTNVRGVTTSYTYYGNNQVASSYVVDPASGSGHENIHSYSYDAAGNRTSVTAPGGLVANTAYDADNHVVSQVTDPAGVNRTTAASYNADGSVVAESLSGGGVTQTETMTYNATDQLLSQTVDNTGGNLTTIYTRDQRGLVTSEQDPAHNITTVANDEDGRAVVSTAPAASSQTGTGAAPVTANPVTTTGYDTFGDIAEESDANGKVTTYGYDQDGRQTSSTDPSYTPPGATAPVNGTTLVVYNNLGLETRETDPLGNITGYGYDQLGDRTSQTDPGTGGVTTYTYDPAGEQTSVTDPTGAQTQTTYDGLGQVLTTTELVRQNTSAAYTTSYAYDAAGNQTSQTSPTGVITRATYDAVGETASATDGAGNTTNFTYNLDGAVTKTTLPDGTASTAAYDLAGRQTSVSDLSASGTVLRTESATYNPDGQVTSGTNFDGFTTTSSYDPTGILTSQTEPVSASHSMTVKYGYDLDGHQTAVTDGNGNITYTTYNSRGLPELITEPPTAAHSSTADSVTKDIYDGDGQLVTQDLPGGVQLSSSYDAMGDATSQSGSGASAPTATRTFTYDPAGRILTAATSAAGTQGSPGYQAATSESFGYDDRGLLLSASGSAGTTVYTYNGSGQPVTAADAAGTSTYGYDSAGRLATDADAASGTTGTYSYNTLGQVTQVSYGTGGNVQSFGYDGLHRLASDTVVTSGGTQVASIGYGYNNDDDVTAMTTSGLAKPGGGSGTITNSYGYDQADRLTSWTATPSGGTAATKNYGYDDNGNLVSDNGTTYAYDARDELTSDGSSTYSYSADGDLLSQLASNGTTHASTTDAFGQQVADAVSSFTWDAMGRLVTAGNQSGSSIALTYEGATNEVASDGSSSYSRDPAGRITGVNNAAGGRLLALVDGHEDLSATFTATGSSMSGSTVYDPWGQVLAASGPAVQVGYQGQWTDPGTGQTDMGARMYRPGTGGFLNRDTAPPSAGANPFAYVDDNPMTLTDVSGHAPSSGKGSGGGGISAGQVAAAGAKAAAAHAKAVAAVAAAAGARAAAALASAVAHGAAALAKTLNNAAAKLAQLAAKAAQLAAEAFKAAQAKLKEAESWQEKADSEFKLAAQDAGKALHTWPWNVPGDLWDAAKAAAAGAVDEARAVAAFAEYAMLEAKALALEIASDVAHGAAKIAALAAKGADKAAQIAGKLADAAARTAQTLEAVAARASAEAASADAAFRSLAAAYAKQEARKLAKIAKATVRVLKKIGHAVKRATVAVAKAAYKYSGAQDVVSCVTHPSLAGCAKAALTVALTVGTAGEGEVAEIGLNAAEHVGEDVAENAGEHAAEEGAGSTVEDAATSCVSGAVKGGESFTADTKVLLASGKAIPISSLKPGEKVLATNTRTGKTWAETISVVMVHHDTNLYDLKIKAGSRTAVIETTSNHPFWDPATHRWVKAAALKYGTHLRTPTSGTATVLGGYTPRDRTGWMWDLTIPGDHDFYIATAAADILVHNCSRNQGVYVFDDISDQGSVYIGKTNNFTRRLGEHITKGKLLDRADAICVHFCGNNDDLLVKEHIFKIVFKDMNFRLSSDVEAHGARWYEARQAGRYPFDK
jgi:RHS repeat-associated protein